MGGAKNLKWQGTVEMGRMIEGKISGEIERKRERERTHARKRMREVARKRKHVREKISGERTLGQERDRKTENKFGIGRENVRERDRGLRKRAEEGEAGLRERIKGMQVVEVEGENGGNDDEWGLRGEDEVVIKTVGEIEGTEERKGDLARKNVGSRESRSGIGK